MKWINGSTVHLEKSKKFLKKSLGRYNSGSHMIHLNLKDINKTEYDNSNLEEKVSIVLTHEYMHKLLFLTEGEDACDAWDNID